MAEREAAAGAIYDIGYQHYDGKRLGRAGAVRALYVHGLRTIFGIGRGGKAKIPPIALIAFMVIPAVIQAFLAALGNGQIQVFTHDGYFRTTVWIFGLFCAFQTPELVSGDQQHRVLALYFSRALLRPDYVLARVGAMATALFVVALLPHMVMLLGEYFAAEHVVDAIKKSLPLIPRILGDALLISVLLATISITVSAIIKRRPFATAAIIGLFLLSSAFATTLVMSRPDKMRYMVLASPMLVGAGLTTWAFDTVTVHPPRDTTLGVPLPPLPPTADSATKAARRIEMRRRFSRRRNGPVEAADLPGAIYLAMTAGLILVSAGVLTLRYRSIET